VDDIVTRIMAIGGTAVTAQLTARHGGGGSPAPASNITALGLPEYGERLFKLDETSLEWNRRAFPPHPGRPIIRRTHPTKPHP
jgi:hypothetical protein